MLDICPYCNLEFCCRTDLIHGSRTHLLLALPRENASKKNSPSLSRGASQREHRVSVSILIRGNEGLFSLSITFFRNPPSLWIRVGTGPGTPEGAAKYS